MEAGAWEKQFIERQRVARLATVDVCGRPHIVPIVFAFDGRQLFTPLDAKPKRVSANQLKRVRNIQVNPHVAVLFDEYSDDWRRLAWVQLRGTASLVESGPEWDTAVTLLVARYPQYTAVSLAGRPIIVVVAQRVTGWRAGGERGQS